MPTSAAMPIYQGDDLNAIVEVKDSTGAAADLTGYAAAAQIRKRVADFEPEVTVEIETVVASPNVYLSIPKTITETLKGQYVWDLQLTSDTGVVTTVLMGKVNVLQEVTREAGKGKRNERVKIQRNA